MWKVQSSSSFGVHVTRILPPSSSGASTAVVSVIGAGGMPSSRPPAVTTGPITMAFTASNCPASSTQTAANQNVLPGSSWSTVELPAAKATSIPPLSATALVIGCWTAHILVRSGSYSMHADHSR